MKKIGLSAFVLGLLLVQVKTEVQMAAERSIVNAVPGQDAELKCQSAEFADFCIFTRFVTAGDDFCFHFRHTSNDQRFLCTRREELPCK